MGRIRLLFILMLALFLFGDESESCEPTVRPFYVVGIPTVENSTHFCVQASYWPQNLKECKGGSASSFVTNVVSFDGGSTINARCDSSLTRCCKINTVSASISYTILYLCASTDLFTDNTDWVALDNTLRFQYIISYIMGEYTRSSDETSESYSNSIADNVIDTFSSYGLVKDYKTIERKSATTCGSENCYSHSDSTGGKISEAACNSVTINTLQ